MIRKIKHWLRCIISEEISHHALYFADRTTLALHKLDLILMNQEKIMSTAADLSSQITSAATTLTAIEAQVAALPAIIQAAGGSGPVSQVQLDAAVNDLTNLNTNLTSVKASLDAIVTPPAPAPPSA